MILQVALVANNGVFTCTNGSLNIRSNGEHIGEFNASANCTIEFDAQPIDALSPSNTFAGVNSKLAGDGIYLAKME